MSVTTPYEPMYDRINWKDRQEAMSTALGAINLNKMDAGLKEADDRIVTLDTIKADQTTVNGMVKDVTYDKSTGIFTITYLDSNKSKKVIDTIIEKIPVNFEYDYSTQKLNLTLDDGTVQPIDLSALITQYEFLTTYTVAINVNSSGKVTADVVEGSIQERHLQPNYLANIKIQASKAETAASNAADQVTLAKEEVTNAKTQVTNATTQANTAKTQATLAKSYAVGGTSSRTGEDTDNAKYYSEQANEVYKNLQTASTVIGVKGDAEDSYRFGQVNLTPDNLGAAKKSLYGDTTIDVGRKNGTTVGVFSTAEGYNTTASGSYSHTEGDNTTASGSHSHAEGAYTIASGDHGSHAEGDNTTAKGLTSHAEGNNTTASGSYSHAEGNNTTASGSYSHTEGDNTTASGSHSHAEGAYTIASGDHGSHAEGDNTTAKGLTSHAEGAYSIASGSYSHAEGYYAKASGFASHAEGSGYISDDDKTDDDTTNYFINTASGSASHAEGYLTTASNVASHAEGKNTTAKGLASHAEGAYSIASGSYSHAEGDNTTAGSHCHAEGYYTKANKEYQHVQGKYNSTKTAAHLVGNGTSDSDRKNIHELDWDGNGWFAGDVTTDTHKLNSSLQKYAEGYNISTTATTFTLETGHTYLLLVYARTYSTDAVYGMTARMIAVPDSSSSTANVSSLTLGVTSNAGFTITVGNFKVEVKASSSTYEVDVVLYDMSGD
jgi:hypothetical protein